MRTLPMLALSLAPAALAVGLSLGHAAAAPSVGSDVTVDDRDYPVCEEEDCSDQPDQVGVWYDPDTGDAWLSQGQRSVPVDPAPAVLTALPGEWARPWISGTDPLVVFAPR